MLKTPFKQCDVTGKKMPESFMIRFVASSDSSYKDKYFYRPNFSK